MHGRWADVDVIMRDARAADELAASEGKRQVIILHTSPSDDTLERIASIVPPDDRLVPAGPPPGPTEPSNG